MLLVTDLANDPIVGRLGTRARYAYLDTVGHCVRHSTDLLAPRELQRVEPNMIDEWESAALVQRLPFGHLRILGRPELWDFDPLVSH